MPLRAEATFGALRHQLLGALCLQSVSATLAVCTMTYLKHSGQGERDASVE
jgi:hypothetical protein